MVFQNNAKLEAELVHLREELANTQATIERLNREKVYLSSALQSSLVKNHKLQYPADEEGSEENPEKVETTKCSEHDEDVEVTVAAKKLAENIARARDLEISSALVAENKRLRADVIELESEMVGARLDNVYLDKELAGRIQQIQLLLANSTPSDVKEKMWSQIESEMCLQRSKTIHNHDCNDG